MSRLYCVVASSVLFLVAVGCSARPAQSEAVTISRLIGQKRYQEALQLADKAIAAKESNSLGEQGSLPILLALHVEICDALNLDRQRDATLARLSIVAPNHELVGRQRMDRLRTPLPEVPQLPHMPEVTSSVSKTAYSYEWQETEDESEPQLAPLLIPEVPAKPKARLNRPGFEARLQAKLAPEFDPQNGWATIPMDAPDVKQVVRADLGMGVVTPMQVRPVSTTGGSPIVALLEDLYRPRRAAIVGQAVRLRSRPNSMCRPRALLPVMASSEEQSLSIGQGFQCADNRDNNGDGLVDKLDPECWAVPNVPSSYSPYLLEGPPAERAPISLPPLAPAPIGAGPE